MVDFLKTKFVSYYKLRLLDAAHNRTRKNIFAYVISLSPPRLLERIKVLNNIFILVLSENDKNLFYTVNMEVLICGCFNGNTGGGCSMLIGLIWWCVSKHCAIKLYIATRKLMYFIARVAYSRINDCRSKLPFNKQTANESLIMTDTATSNIISREEKAKESAKATLVNINNILTEFIDRSPIEVTAGLHVQRCRR